MRTRKLEAGREKVGEILVKGTGERGRRTGTKPAESADQEMATGFAAATIADGSTV